MSALGQIPLVNIGKSYRYSPFTYGDDRVAITLLKSINTVDINNHMDTLQSILVWQIMVIRTLMTSVKIMVISIKETNRIISRRELMTMTTIGWKNVFIVFKISITLEMVLRMSISLIKVMQLKTREKD